MNKFKGYHGESRTPCEVLFYNGWYCIKGGESVLLTYDEVKDGIHVDEINDSNIFTVIDGVHSIEELVHHVDEYEEYLKEAYG